MKISIVITLLNEASNVNKLLTALVNQSKKPDEIIMVDGGSTDNSAAKIKKFKSKNLKSNISFFKKIGNRSVGRNYGVFKAEHKWIAFTDAGCIPDKNWLEELSKTEKASVIAGYYYGLAKSNFEEAVVPYALVMPDRVDPNNFLPSTRSMLIKKSIFNSLGRFDESLSDNEDYEFARRIKAKKIPIKFAGRAKVAWMPSENLFKFTKMIFRFAKGDSYAKIFRPKVLLIFFRYILFSILLIYFKQIFLILFLAYLFWSILKNKKYVKKGWYYLPILQITSDIAVMLGSLAGYLRGFF